MNITQQTNKKRILIFLVLFQSLIGQTNVSAFSIKDHKLSLSCAAASTIAIGCSAYLVYKQDMIASNKPYSISDFIKKFPHLFKQALLGESRLLHKNHPWFCKSTKLLVAGTAIAAVLETMPDLKNNQDNNNQDNNNNNDNNNYQVATYYPLVPAHIRELQERLKDDRFHFSHKPLPRHAQIFRDWLARKEPENYEFVWNQNLKTYEPILKPQKPGIAYSRIANALPLTNCSPAIIAERTKEEEELKNDQVLLERNTGCLFCKHPFNDEEQAYFYGCNPTHLYHQGCIAEWEGSYKYEQGCGQGCGNNDTVQIQIKLRKHDHPNFKPLVKVNRNGELIDPHDGNGNLVTHCTVCDRKFEDGTTVVYTGLHPQCGTNHIVHPNCFTRFRTETAMTFAKNKQGPFKCQRQGFCWEVRGISCPAHCIDPICTEPYGQRKDANRPPLRATVHYTVKETEEERRAREEEERKLLLHPLLREVNLTQLPPIPADMQHDEFDRRTNSDIRQPGTQCIICNTKSTDTKGRYWTVATCADCGAHQQYCSEFNANKRRCLSNENWCYACSKSNCMNTNNLQWYRN